MCLEYDSLAKVIAKHPNRKETTKYVIKIILKESFWNPNGRFHNRQKNFEKLNSKIHDHSIEDANVSKIAKIACKVL